METTLKVFAFCTLLLVSTVPLSGQGTTKQRLIVLTDIGSDPDDVQSMVRLMLYSNQIDIEGLIASTSVHQPDAVSPEMIRNIISKYKKVQSNLLKHEPGFPSAKKLQVVVKQGLPVYGMDAVGEGKDSEGSDWIIKMLEKKDDRPLWVVAWGGPCTLAQALWKIRQTKSETEVKRLTDKLRVYTISDQDNTGSWIRKSFKNIFYIVSPGDYTEATWFAMNYICPCSGANKDLLNNEWLNKNIQQGHGELGAVYPDVAFGVEGDTPSFLMLIPNGLNNPEHPNWGSWGGRYELYKPVYKPKKWLVPVEEETRPIWTNAEDDYTPRVQAKFGRAIVKDTGYYKSNYVTLWRWFEDFQNDFAARMSWCNMSYKEANHPPVVMLTTPGQLTVKSGETFDLDASPSFDPDKDGLSFFWFQYKEAGTCKSTIKLSPENLSKTRKIKAPAVDTLQTVHFIVKVTDKGTPRLSRYKRVIVTIVPNK